MVKVEIGEQAGSALAKVVEWHKGVAAGEDARELSFRQLEEYSSLGGVSAGEVRA